MAEKSKGGRPTDLSKEVQDKVCEALLEGTTRIAAIQYAGLSSRTFSRWMENGRKKNSGKYRQFRLAVIAAESECQRKFERVIQKAALEREVVITKETSIINDDGTESIKIEKTTKIEIDWAAGAWWLERRRRKEYHLGYKPEEEEAAKAGESVLVIRLNKDDIPPPEVEDKR